MKKKSLLAFICSVILAGTMLAIPVYANDSTTDSDSQGQLQVQSEEAPSEGDTVSSGSNYVVIGGESLTVEVSEDTKDARSNNEKIASVYFEEFNNTITIYGNYIGSTEIVLTDSNNQETTLFVVVEAPPFELDTTKLTISGSYRSYYYWNSYDELVETDEDGEDIYETAYDYEPLYWIRTKEDSSESGYYDEYDNYYELSYSGPGIQISPTTDTNIVSVVSSNTKVVRIDSHGSHQEYGCDDDGHETDVIYTLYDCFDIHPVGSGTATLTCTGQYGEKATVTVNVTKGFMSSLLEKRSSCPNLKYGSKTITGTAPAGTAISIKIGKKKYKVTANSQGDYTIKKIPVYKMGTKIKYSLSYRGGSYSVTKKIIKPGTKISLSTTFRKTKTVKVTLKNVRKGEWFKLKIGKKTYKKKIPKTASKYTFKIKVAKTKKAGSKMKATVTNKYKQTLATKSGKVYYAAKIRKGMTKAQCKLVPGWEHPYEVSVSGKYTIWWYDDDHDGFAVDSALRFKKGKLIGWFY